MSKKWIVTMLVVTVLAMTAVSVAQAGDGITTVDIGDGDVAWKFTDGRINAFDMSAPVAVYYTTETRTNDDTTNYEVVTGLELLAIDPVTETGHLVVKADVAAVKQLMSGAVSVIEADGYSLHYSSGTFWVVAPADAEGKVYSFAWETTAFSS
ncbi:MAG TPA: hypothetical protein VHO69_10125 [Phototrophicaceae bacterium]|nr:hypothetical protein [Phototrophicaceae bacterium]